ncbi:histone-lysine N-methyltransferase SETD1B isoform X2 [Cajanus cajan]|uniref:UBA domain-containing protein 7 n=1 Tax=Cajanus cajan TaxID=3821 RepID=A0A151SDW9_CAJCA|nr:histone-lysine N-methyltransferase SETD1B isoform X2 [Cajanus cajan]KYP52996.1 UBA domain-containing protein 7 [Cajanus cajan]
MDESQRIGSDLMRGLPRLRSVEDRSSSRRQRPIFTGAGVGHSESDDFSDVFGGPPRTLLAHKFSSSGTFYEEIFRRPEFSYPAAKGGRSLPVFRIPARNEGFYSDIFGSDDERKSRERSRSLSKENSSSAMSSEELSPCRPAIGDDVALSGFASRLRPINVSWRWNSSTEAEEHPSKHGVPLFAYNNGQTFENEYKENMRSSYLGSSRRVSSPETASLESNSYQSIKVFTDDWDLNSVVSSIYQEPQAKLSVHDHVLSQQNVDFDDDDDDDDEAMSSYVIELNSNLRREECEASDIDEAIAWAKEKFQSRSSDEESSVRHDGNGQTVGTGSSDASEYHTDKIGIVQTQEKQQTETEKLDRDIRLWSSGNETDIRLLLSTLHHILSPESGWYAIPLMSLLESSKVKKGYQRARLCLHPDKLQQRGATPLQKYVAEKAFSVLQDAWAAFISEDVSF